MRPTLDKKKYLVTFIITAIIFTVMLYINNLLDQKRLVDVKAVQDQISLDLLSSETQFNLLRESSCENIGSSTVLSTELNSLAKKLSYLESNDTGKPNPELTYLKKYYSLLEIKDFILMKQINQKCSSKPISILYFYGNKSDCADCEKMSYVLTYLREQYPELRIYSFDTNLNLSAIDTLNTVYHINSTKLPALVYNENTFVGYKSIDEMKEIIPALKKIDKQKAKNQQATSTATSTKN
jgi:hypothetical protein